nr:reverse transcriptase zinc-binding domain-containing protein [Tanacetum cinerariifolium]
MKISELEECVRIKDRQHIIRASDDFIIFENLRAQVQELQSDNEHLKSKVVVCTMCQNLQVQVEELKSVNESSNLSVEELYKARTLAEVTLRERDELVFVQSEKIRLLEEQYEIFFALKEIESLKDEIKSLQIENQDLKSRESELNNLEKVYETKESMLLKDIDQMKSQVSELVKTLEILDQKMKQQIILFEEDKRILGTKFKILKHDNYLEKMFEMIEQEYESNISKISITSSTTETKILELVKEMGDKVKRFDDEKKVFENKILKMKKVLEQRVKDFDDVKTELSRRTDKFETYFANLEKENALLKSQLAS